jgi:hypothetical protein
MSESNSCGVTLSAAESRIEERRLEKIGKQIAEAIKSIRNIVIFSALPIKLLSTASRFQQAHLIQPFLESVIF